MLDEAHSRGEMHQEILVVDIVDINAHVSKLLGGLAPVFERVLDHGKHTLDAFIRQRLGLAKPKDAAGIVSCRSEQWL